MALVLTWKPVLQILALKDYHPDYVDEKIMVCVNPQPEFLRERTSLMTDYSTRLVEVDTINRKAEFAGEEKKSDATILAGQKSVEFFNWCDQVFLPGIQGWFARLWSFGEEQFSVDDLNQYQEIDPHFLAWAKVRSIEMIDAHASARKKA